MNIELALLTPEAWSLSSGLTAVLLVAMGLACLHLAHRDREPGMVELGLSALLIAVFYSLDAANLTKPRGSVIQPQGWLSLLLVLGIGTWTFGMGRVLGQRPGWRQPLVPILLAPTAVVTALIAGGTPLPRAAGNVVLTLVFLGMAALAWRQRSVEPRAGHGWVAASIVAIPAFAILLYFSGFTAVALRYLIMAPLLVFYLTILVVTVRRRSAALAEQVERRRSAEQALEAANASLERSVQQRTADLHDMVAGLESFNRSVSHDLRGPLGGIEGAARLAADALERQDIAAAQTLLDAIANQARTSRVLVASLLELARVGDARLSRREISLEELAREAIEDIRRHATAGTLPVFALGPLPTVRADADLLRPVLGNLIGNACKFSAGQTAPRVEIGARREPDGITVCVRDNGVGFQSDRAAELFQPFHRLHGARFTGHGVGLSIVRRAVERHGGVVWAEGRPGEGAAFYFTLPDA